MSTLESNSKFSLVSSGELQVCQSFIPKFNPPQVLDMFVVSSHLNVKQFLEHGPIHRGDKDQMIEVI